MGSGSRVIANRPPDYSPDYSRRYSTCRGATPPRARGTSPASSSSVTVPRVRAKLGATPTKLAFRGPGGLVWLHSPLGLRGRSVWRCPCRKAGLNRRVVPAASRREVGLTISHHNRKNPSATVESGDAEGEYRDSTAIGAAVDMIVSVSRGKMPRARRLTPSGRWPEDPLTVVVEPGVGYELAPDLEEDEQARAPGTGRRRAARGGAARRRERADAGSEGGDSPSRRLPRSPS